MCLALPLDRLSGFPADGPFSSFVQLGGIFYLFVALRRVYGEGRRRTVVKLFVLLGAHTVAGVFSMALTLLWVTVEG